MGVRTRKLSSLFKKKHLPDLAYIDNFEIKVKLIQKLAELQIAEARMVIQ